jgi:hypothetical protein
VKLLCRVGLHAWTPVIKSPDGRIERQNCERPGCRTGRVLYLEVEVERGTDWWFDVERRREVQELARLWMDDHQARADARARSGRGQGG